MAVALDRVGILPEALNPGLETFRGVRRRQEVRGVVNNITVIDDFAHHPTAVRSTVEAIRGAYKDARLTAVFEPRSNTSRRDVFQKDFALAFDPADIVLIREPPDIEKIPDGHRISVQTLVQDLVDRDIDAHLFPDTDGILRHLTTESRPGDVILIMSNGGFDNLHIRLLEGLKQ